MAYQHQRPSRAALLSVSWFVCPPTTCAWCSSLKCLQYIIHQSQHSVVWRGAWAHGSVRIWQLPILMWIRLFECWFKKPCRFCNFIQYFLKNLELCEVWTGPCTILLPHIIFLAIIKQNFDNSLFSPLIYKNSCSF